MLTNKKVIVVAILQWQNYMTAITFKICTSVNAYDFHPLNNVHDDYTIKKGLHQNNLLTQPLFLYRIN